MNKYVFSRVKPLVLMILHSVMLSKTRGLKVFVQNAPDLTCSCTVLS